MPEFSKGDLVRYKSLHQSYADRQRVPVGAILEISSYSSYNEPYVTMKWDDGQGTVKSVGCFAYRVEPIEAPW